MTDPWRAILLDEVEGYAGEGKAYWHMLRSTLGVGAFGVNAWRGIEDGQELIGEHDELGSTAAGHEELYLVLCGHATFTVDGKTVEAPARTLVFVQDPALKRSAVARDEGTTVLVVGATAGKAFTVSPWERSAEALRHWTTGEWGKAIELLERQLEQQPDEAVVLYNLACAEARGGDSDSALEHLREAVALGPQFLDAAQDDADFASIRDDARFPRP